MNIQEFREKFPMYDKVPDQELADRVFKKLYADKMPRQEFMNKFIGPPEPEKKDLLTGFRRIYNVAQQESQAGMEAMEQFANRPTAKNITPAVLGAGRYMMSWPTAIMRGGVQMPVEETMRSAGVPEPITKTVGEMAGMGDMFIPYGAVVKTAIKGAEAAGLAGKVVSKLGQKTTVEVGTKIATKPPLKMPGEVPAKLATELAAEGQLSKPIIQETIQEQVKVAAKEIITQLPPNDKKRIGQQVVDLIYDQSFNWKELPNVLTKYGITPQEFAQRLKDTYSTAGRTLGRLSAISKQIQSTIKDNPEAQKFFNSLNKELPDPTGFDKLYAWAYGVESKRRAFLVTQLATAMRNAITQTGRAVIGSLDDFLQGAIKSTVGAEGNIRQIGDGLDTYVAFLNRFRPSARKNLTNILEAEHATIYKTKLLGTPVHEVSLGSDLANLLNTPNRFQEIFFRKIAFESKMTQLLEKSGQNIKNIDPSKIPLNTYEKATGYALEMTFAAMPKSKKAQEFIRNVAGNPLATALFNPFPRFAFGNALPFMINFSPISFMKALNPKVVAELAHGNPDKFAEHASRAMIGSSMLGLGVYLRGSKYAGEKWYQTVNPDKPNERTDWRSFAPLSTPLLIAEAMVHPERLSTQDWVQAAIGLNRIAGTGLVITDVLRSKKIETTKEIMQRLAGEYLGSFSVPARTFQDLYAHFNPEEAKLRDTRESTLTGPFQRNIPIMSQRLPETKTPLSVEQKKAEYPLTRQTTGLSISKVTPIESEVNRLAIDRSRIFPRTGVPEADRKLSEIMAPEIEIASKTLMGLPLYQKSPDHVKRLFMGALFQDARRRARKTLAVEDPGLYTKIRIEGFSEDITELIGTMGGKVKR